MLNWREHSVLNSVSMIADGDVAGVAGGVSGGVGGGGVGGGDGDVGDV